MTWFLRLLERLFHSDDPDSANSPSPRRDAHVLSATRQGLAISANGRVETVYDGSWQRFFLVIDAAVPDGTTFVLWINDRAAGTLVTTGGEADLDIAVSDDDALPAGFPGVKEIRKLAVATRAGEPILLAELSAPRPSGSGSP